MGPAVNNGAVRVGVVGAGVMGAAHIRTLASSVPGAAVTEVYDPDVAKARSAAAGVGARAAESAEDLITSPDLDAVVITAPDALHAELLQACIGARRPTLCEKPLATTVEDSRRVVEAETATGRRLVQVGFMRRYDPAFVALRDQVVGGDVGRVRVVHCVHRNARSHPGATTDGIVGNSMIHELDGLRWLLDSPIAAITVRAATVPAGALRDPQVAVVETASGVLATIEVFLNAGYGYDIQCEVVGDGGTARLIWPSPPGRHSAGRERAEAAPDFVTRFADAYRVELSAWVDSIRRGTAIDPSAWDGHAANLVAAAGVASLHSGERVSVEVERRPDLYG
jgi:myo-inositol 2-dehydrogenase/D-chiro-inositol 1-dehydrogenase